jgi:hypothetical protein
MVDNKFKQIFGMKSMVAQKNFKKGLIIRKIFVIFFSISPKLRYGKIKFGDIIKIGECLEF